jgi:nickel superoxide dismutase
VYEWAKGEGDRGDCEIPCGIYDDPLRTGLIAEHFTTTVKSMKKIVVLR